MKNFARICKKMSALALLTGSLLGSGLALAAEDGMPFESYGEPTQDQEVYLSPDGLRFLVRQASKGVETVGYGLVNVLEAVAGTAASLKDLALGTASSAINSAQLWKNTFEAPEGFNPKYINHNSHVVLMYKDFFVAPTRASINTLKISRGTSLTVLFPNVQRGSLGALKEHFPLAEFSEPQGGKRVKGCSLVWTLVTIDNPA